VDRKLVTNAAVSSNAQSVAGDAYLSGRAIRHANFELRRARSGVGSHGKPVVRSDCNHGISNKTGRNG